MQKLSVVVVSALVLGLGLRVFADSAFVGDQTSPTTARQAVSAPTIAVAHTPTSTTESQTALVKQYCATCHNDRNKNNAGGLSLQAFDSSKVGRDGQVAEVAEKMIRKLRSGMMPPAGARRPEPQTINSFAASMETRLDQAAALNPNPGHRPFQRLNRAEYTRAVKAVLALDVDVSAFL